MDVVTGQKRARLSALAVGDWMKWKRRLGPTESPWALQAWISSRHNERGGEGESAALL